MEKIVVLHILEALNCGGIESVVVNICNNMDKERFDVHLLVLSGDDLQLRDKLNDEVKFHTLGASRRDVMSIVRCYGLTTKIHKMIKEIKPDILHTHCMQFRLTSTQLAFIGTKYKRYVHTIHTSGLQYEQKTIKYRIKLWYENIVYKLTKAEVACVSKDGYNKCKELFPNVPLHLIENGINIVENPNKVDFIDTAYINMVYIARLDEGKNQGRLIEAFSLLCQKVDNVRLYLVGDGILMDNLQEQIKQLGLEGKVFLMGRRNDVIDICSSCQVGVFSSLFEGFSIAAVEMASVRLPMVVSNIPALKDVFEDTAIYFDPTSVDEIYEKLLLICQDEDLRKELGEKAFGTAKKYSIKNTARLYQEVYTK
jgi:glycosyltransferase involved in cell wall biosynthesis